MKPRLLGPRSPATDPTSERVEARLAACHARIRAFSREARGVAEAADGPLRRASARALVAYFEHAFALHGQDEDLRVVPRLAESARELIAARLRSEHARLEAQTGALLETWRHASHSAVEVDPVATAAWSDALEAHLTFEEDALFPEVQRLPDDVQRELVQAMVAARSS